MSERESKREWLKPGGDGTAPGYEWTYYLLGGTKEQLSVWQGTQTSEVGFCGSTGGSQIYFYPTEYLTYGGRSANITTHPNGTQEYRIADHLGSNRVTLDNTGSVVTTTDYEPYGKAIAGVPPRKGFIDKEKDQESGLGDFGVRKYDDGIGRFTSIDPLTEKMPSWSPYVYSFNSPLVLIDPNGRFPGDYYDVDGNHLGDDGIDDDKIYIVRKDVDLSEFTNSEGDVDWARINSEASHLFIVAPSKDVRKEITNKVYNNIGPSYYAESGGAIAYDKENEKERFIYGGINFGDGGIYDSPNASKEVKKAMDEAKEKGYYVTWTVHSHPHPLSEPGGGIYTREDAPSEIDIKSSGIIQKPGILISHYYIYFYGPKGVEGQIRAEDFNVY